MSTKTPVEEFPYKTYLNILHGPLELIDVQKLGTLARTNGTTRRFAR